MRTLDEKALRREPFREGYAVELADGQRWMLPPVQVRYSRMTDEDGEVFLGGRPWFADQFEDELDVLFGIVASPWDRTWLARMKIVAALLKANYDLSDADIDYLTMYIPGDAANVARWGRIREAMMGRDPDEPAEGEGEDPKAGPSSNGCDSPAGPTDSPPAS